MMPVLHINDNNLLLQTGSKTVRSQGYAWLKSGEVYFDFEGTNNAVAACRLEPQQINSRYWQQCEQTALSENNSGMRHAADLIWRHLSEFKARFDPSKLLLVVPSHLQASNLQLLLGVAQAAGVPIAGLLNKAAISLAASSEKADLALHVDVQLHQTVCTEVRRQRELWQMQRIEILHEVGVQAMQDALLKAAQERFIKSDRFDPLHYAETEQQLFDQLPQLADAIEANGKATMTVEHGGKKYTCNIDERQWSIALKPFAEILKTAIIESEPNIRHLDFNGFNGFMHADEHNRVVEAPVLTSSQQQLAAKTDAEGNVVYLTEFPAENSSAQVLETKVSAKSAPHQTEKKETQIKQDRVDNKATHLMCDGVAIAIEGVQVSLENGLLSIAESAKQSNLGSLLVANKLFVIGAEARNELHVNDRLGSDLVDGVLTAIKVRY